jgi:hypothetical protein
MNSVSILLRHHIDVALKDNTLHILATRSSRLADNDVSNLVLDGLKAMGNTPIIHIFNCKFLVL